MPNNIDIKEDTSPMTQGQLNILMDLLQKSSFSQVSKHTSSNQVVVGHSSASNIHQFMHNCGQGYWIIDS